MLKHLETNPSSSDETADATPRYRSGAVARMVRMPVATLRIWERRYHVAAPATTPTGHRLYTGADVQRLALLKQLTDMGHAIGALAGLDIQALRQVAATHVRSLTVAQPVTRTLPAARRIAVVGDGLLRRMQAPGLLHRLGQEIEVAAVFGSVTEATSPPQGLQLDTLLAQVAGLHAEWLAPLQAAAAALKVRRVVVCHGFGTAAARQAFEAAGVVLLQGVQSDRALADALRSPTSTLPPSDGETPVDTSLASTHAWSAGNGHGAESTELHALIGAMRVAPRRYLDTTLVDLASLSSTIACECPRHVAELLMLLSQFESYSSECSHASQADADLHAYLQRVAGVARGLFEAALERVAVHEGLMLPA
ncbi:MAG: MerR family transcriptional regulator [Pseudomonadota bacterium]